MKDTIQIDNDRLGLQMDQLLAKKDTESVIQLIERIEEVICSRNEKDCATLYYYMGTAYSSLASWHQQPDKRAIQTEYLKKALTNFRKAMLIQETICKPTVEDKDLLLCVYTNYANALESCGRIIETVRMYRKALEVDSSFSMAEGNYGRILSRYAQLVNDPGHKKELHCYAYQALKRSLSSPDFFLHEGAQQFFSRIINRYEEIFPKSWLNAPIIFPKYKLGMRPERAYRLWCLEHHLFLHPLNDLIDKQDAFAHDPLVISRIIEESKEAQNGNEDDSVPPKWFAMFNQIKEEYAYARFLCYEGIEKSRRVHFADKDVKLTFASFDYTTYSIRLEQIKSAFRILYSIFDQISFAINLFWDIGLTERKADANNLFRNNRYPRDNMALSGIYWSHQELLEFGCEHDLNTLRNALEHKYVKVHAWGHKSDAETAMTIGEDGFYHINEEDLNEKALRILELAREWILNFAYAIEIKERSKESTVPYVHLQVFDYDDALKL